MGKGGQASKPVRTLRSTITSLAADEPSPAKRQKPYPVKPDVGTGQRELVAVTNPATGETIAQVEMCTSNDVDASVAAAQAALPGWAGLTSKRRAAIMLKFHSLVMEHRAELVELIILENGKNRVESEGDIAKGLETVEWAAALPQIDQGRTLTVSTGVVCSETREPVGVVASIVPFNFPFMVPMWTCPIALVAGNCVLLKPSEKVPMTMDRTFELLLEAGVPRGVFQLLHGGVDAVQRLCDHPHVDALTFVGSSRVAKIVHDRARAAGKKALALGGAKNHLVAAADAPLEMAAADVVASFAGCAGQRCMAASVLLTIGAQPQLVAKIVEKAAKLKPGQAAGCVGPVIDAASEARMRSIVDAAVADGAEVLLDGRGWRGGGTEGAAAGGTWFGPTVLRVPAAMGAHACMTAEIFGPVLCVREVAGADEALAIENGDPHGNAACIYTSSGATADYFSRRFRAGMVGVNIGVPVPREPFSFGGLEGTASKYGEHDITGDGALRFFSQLKKITTKWTTTPNAPPDAANFGGTM